MAEELLKIEHLTKKFEDNMILDDVSLTVHRGEVIVVVGPSGCGKSTMLRCINALEPIQGGTIEIEGQQISQSSKNLTQLRQKIGMVFQSYELFPHLTVLNNILLAPAKVQKRDKEEVKKRIQEAEQYVKKEQLCLSPQCGFSSTEEGNIMTEDEQWAKVKLVKEIAEEVWG